jgi:hypothetical protein
MTSFSLFYLNESTQMVSSRLTLCSVLTTFSAFGCCVIENYIKISVGAQSKLKEFFLNKFLEQVIFKL